MRISDDFAELLYSQIHEAQSRNAADYANAIRDYKPIFESVFKNLTAGLPQAFNSVFSRIAFVADAQALDSDFTRQIYSFRGLSAKLTKDSDMVLEQNQYLVQFKHLCQIVAHFSDILVPDELSSVYKNVENVENSLDTKLFASNSVEIENIRCLVSNISDIQTTSQGVHFFSLICQHEGDFGNLGDLGSFTVVVWPQTHTDIDMLKASLFPYCSLYISHLKHYPDKPNSYQTSHKTQIVLEPDFLIDVTDVAECFQKDGANPMLFFLSKLIGFDGNAATLKGKIVNDILDNLICKPAAKYKQIFGQSVMDNLLQAVSIGYDGLRKIYESIEKEHLAGLAEVANLYKNSQLRIEPTFISANYGMQGRLDVLIEDAKEPARKEIFELKSGKPPSFGAWKNNEMQVVAYNMLLRSAYGPQRLGSSSIFYSAATQNRLRNITDNMASEHKVIELRNRLVSALHALCRGDSSVLMQMNPENFGMLPDFKKHELACFWAVYSHASALEQLYYNHFLAFCLREHQNAKTGSRHAEHRDEGGFASLWRSSLIEKQNRFAVLHSLKLTHICPNTGHLHLQADPDLQHNFRQGDSGIVYPHHPTSPNALSGQILKGHIVSLNNNEIVFSLRTTQLGPQYFENHGAWIIEHDFQESSYWKSISGLYSFLKADKQLRDLVLGLVMPKIEKTSFEPLPHLNPNQNELLKKAIEAKDYFLLQGPPGTGKTSSMLVSLVAHTLKNSADTVLVVLAFTNRAVEEISDKLSGAGIDFLRLGNKGNHSHEDSLKTEDFSIQNTRVLIGSKRVFIATVACFASRLADLSSIVRLHTLIIDEASQLTEPQIVGLLPAFKKFVLIGDQNQLPAVVSQGVAHTGISEPLLYEIGLIDLGQSLFERLYKLCIKNHWNHACGMLENHFRMHDQIASLINPYYQNCLKTALVRQNEPFELYIHHSDNPLARLLHSGRVLFVETPKQSGAKTNQQEASRALRIIKLVRNMYGSKFCSSTIGLISPWRAQVACIQRLIDAQMPEDGPNIQTDTVERFQGGEKDIIIASLSIDHSSRLEAMQSINLDCSVDRKLLVTISRAKEQLIILGNRNSLNKSPFYVAMIAQIERNGGFIDDGELMEGAFGGFVGV